MSSFGGSNIPQLDAVFDRIIGRARGREEGLATGADPAPPPAPLVAGAQSVSGQIGRRSLFGEMISTRRRSLLGSR